MKYLPLNGESTDQELINHDLTGILKKSQSLKYDISQLTFDKLYMEQYKWYYKKKYEEVILLKSVIQHLLINIANEKHSLCHIHVGYFAC